MAATSTATIADTSSSFITSSISSLSSAWNQPPNVARVYKQAFQLFITRRTSEALEVLQPILQPADSIDNSADRAIEEQHERAPVALASKNARVKVWNLYISILNSALEMGSGEGKRQFGAAAWMKLASKTRDGQVWAEVVQNGYDGKEGQVDPEVVASL